MCGQGEKLSKMAAPLVGPGKGQCTILCGLGCTYVEDSTTLCIAPNLIQHNTSNTIRSHNSATANVETGSKLIEHRGGEALREDIDELRCRRNMEYADLTHGDSLSNKIKINLHMFGVLMLNGVDREVHGADVVAVDESAPRRQTLELMEQLAQPGGFSHAVGDGAVLGFHAGPRDDRLSLGRPGHKVVPEEHRIAGRRVQTSSPVSVSVDDEVEAGRAAQKDRNPASLGGSTGCTS
jgi:hypothetical protein